MVIKTETDPIRVSGNSEPQAVASAIYKMVYIGTNDQPCVRAMGGPAVAKACTSIAIARGLVAVNGRDLVCTIGMETIVGSSGDQVSATTFHLYLR